MKKQRFIITAVMAAALAVFSFTACGGTGGDMQQQATDAAAYSGDAGESQATQTIPEQSASETAPLLYQDDGTPAGVEDIGAEKVMAIALERVPGATASDIYELEKEYDDGRLEYEGSIYYGGYEYEFDIDGSTGNILQWEIDD